MADGQGRALTFDGSRRVRVHITRRGGLAGVALSADLDTDSLGKEAAAGVEHALQRLVAASGERASLSHPDEFEYDISLPDSNQSAQVGESDLPSELRPLIRALTSQGKIDSSRGNGPA